jgi:hypothetical protein
MVGIFYIQYNSSSKVVGFNGYNNETKDESKAAEKNWVVLSAE